MARSSWKGNIAFEGVRVPVSMFPAIKSGRGFSLSNAHDKDNGRLKQQYVCQICNEIVEKEDKVKAYFSGKKDMKATAVFSQDEIDMLSLDNSDTIQVIAVKENGVEGDIHELALRGGKPYYFGRQETGSHIFSFFHSILKQLKKQNKFAIGIAYMRGKPILIRFEPYQNVILGVEVVYPSNLHLNHEDIDGADEVVSKDLTEKGIKIAKKIEKKEFDYMQQKDSFVIEAQKRLEQKILGKELKIEVKEEIQVKKQDLEAMISASL